MWFSVYLPILPTTLSRKYPHMFLILFFFAYQLLQIFCSPFILGYFIVRFFKKKPLGTWNERLGFVPIPDNLQEDPRGERPHYSQFMLWIHAVSVGEVLSIEHFITLCKQQNPNIQVYLTCGTITGKQVAQKLGADKVSFLPFDFLLPMYLAFKRIKPSAIIIVEAEIWPNFLMLAHYKKIPLYLLNGRINPTSAHKRKFIGFLYKLFTKIFVPSNRALNQFTSLGIEQNRITLLGDIKAFNVVEKKDAYLKEHGEIQSLKNYTVVLAGSIHAAELDIYLASYHTLKPTMPNLRLILVPRHFHWQQELMQKLIAHNISYKLWTADTKTSDIASIFEHVEVLVVCRLGILFSLYQIATIYCLGGTFVPVGGHNLLEPAVWGKPCIIGPYHHMCLDTAEQLHKNGGLIKTNSAQELQSVIAQLAQNPDECKKMGMINVDLIDDCAKKTKELLLHFIQKI